MRRRSIYIVLSTIILLIVGITLINIYRVFLKSNTLKEGFLYIPTNSTLATVDSLTTPFLNNTKTFKYVASYVFSDNKIRAGKYKLQKGMSNYEIANLIKSGKQTIVHVSFNNQDNFEKLAGRIATQIEADSISLLKAFQDSTFIYSQHFTEKTALAMYIPNTYDFYWNTSATTFRNKMLIEYLKFWNENRKAKAKKLNLSLTDIITLASIVQKETSTINERPKVAQLYLNRLKNNWPLQADPTIIFAIKNISNNNDTIKRVLKKDLTIKSPYNTYIHNGLPPGLIAMPDISSIDAVLNPTPHNYFYMCASTINPGQHVFATSLAEHNKNALKYRIWLNKIGINR